MKKSFTLAETLITLTILGVIATITIPQLKTNVQEKITVAKVNNTFKLLEDSYRLARMRYGDMKKWGLTSASEGSNPSSSVAANMLLGDVIGEEKSFKTIYINYLTSKTAPTTIALRRLKNGVWVSGLWIASAKCKGTYGTINNYCGDLSIDINGPEKPNVMGRDVFQFLVTNDHIIPRGVKGIDTRTPLKQYCNMKSDKDKYNGYACTAWVVYKKNMDYLRKEVDWDKDD